MLFTNPAVSVWSVRRGYHNRTETRIHIHDYGRPKLSNHRQHSHSTHSQHQIRASPRLDQSILCIFSSLPSTTRPTTSIDKMQLIAKSLVATVALFHVVASEVTWGSSYVFQSMLPPMNSTAAGIAYSTDNSTNELIASIMWYNTNNTAAPATASPSSTPKSRISTRKPSLQL